ncbi:hypothetical protein C7N83_10610 [Neisseria iguanae]|uniref:Uncharacterized protein n=2 Tax=Neisseria iguanae TaxID=90242 RepID=A0A2P7TYE2_9NEIS|nr:hypothetical protein C7N83_10610 [Neisseria iguanae]
MADRAFPSGRPFKPRCDSAPQTHLPYCLLWKYRHFPLHLHRSSPMNAIEGMLYLQARVALGKVIYAVKLKPFWPTFAHWRTDGTTDRDGQTVYDS